MKTASRTLSLMCRLGLGAAALLLTQHAFADGADTNYGTTISNTALVDYEVAGNPQPQETSGPVTFDVDRLVNFTVVETTAVDTPTTLGADGTAPGNTNYVEFTVTNLTNGPLDFNLSVLTPQSGADDFDMLNPRVEIDDGNGDADFTGGDYIDDLAENGSILVRIYADTPTTGTNGWISLLSLIANGADPAGTTAAPGANLDNTGAWIAGTVQNVFGDAGNDNSETDEMGFVIGAPDVTVSKTVVLVSDPFGSADPRAVPGSVMRYEIEIANAGGDAASNISIGDVIDASIELREQVAGISTITITDDGGTSTTCDAETGGADTNGDGCFYSAAAIPPAAARTLTVAGMNTAGDPINVPAGETWVISFEVVIQ